MRKKLVNKLLSILFLSVFFCKMVITVMPLIIAHFDKNAVNAVIMQLEIENNAKSNDVKETSVKEYLTVGTFGFASVQPTQLVLSAAITIDHDKHVQAFYPPVATPPPNV